jgi:hypothetical protein
MSFKCFLFISNVNIFRFKYEPKTICIFKTTAIKMAGNFRTLYVTSRGDPPGHKIWVREFFSLFYIIITQKTYIHKKLDTNSCFAKLRAISNLFSFFLYTLYVPRSTFQANALCQEIRTTWDGENYMCPHSDENKRNHVSKNKPIR